MNELDNSLLIIDNNSQEIIIKDFLDNYQKYNYDDFMDDKIGNDFEKIVLQKYPSIRKSYDIVSKFTFFPINLIYLTKVY